VFQQKPARLQEFQDLATRRCSSCKTNPASYSSQNRCWSRGLLIGLWTPARDLSELNVPAFAAICFGGVG
jgi:hypothetical protein